MLKFGAPPTATASRKKLFLSPSARSISIAVSGSAQNIVADVSGPPNCTDSSPTRTCTIAVSAPPGTVTFTLTLYDGLNATGNVLGSGSATTTVVLGTPFTVTVVAAGAPAAVALSLANAYFPVGVGGTTIVTLTVKDPDGNVIVGPYATPITVSAPAGVLLGTTAASQTQSTLSVGDSATTIYASVNGSSSTSLTLTASAGNVSASAALVPTTHLRTYTGPPVLGGSSLFRIVKGPDGALYFGDLGPTAVLDPTTFFVGPTSSGAIGRVDPKTGTVTEVRIAGYDPIGLLFVGNDLYVAELLTGSVGKIAGAAAGGFTAANYSQLTLPNAPPSVAGGVLAGTHYDRPRDLWYLNGNLYVTCSSAAQVAIVPLAQWPSNAGVTYVTTPSRATGSHADGPDGITLGGDGAFYLAEAPSGYLTRWVAGQTSMTDLAGTAAKSYPGGAELRFAATGADGKVYFTSLAFDGTGLPIQSYASGTFTSLPAAPHTAPDSIHAGSGTTVVASDLGLSSADVYDTSNGAFRVYPVWPNADPKALPIQDVADDGNGSYWFTSGVFSQNFVNGGFAGYPTVTIRQLQLAQGWQVLPEGANAIDGLGASAAIPLAIAQAATAHDTVALASTTPSICTVNAQSGYANLYYVTGVAPGSCILTASDQTNRVVTVTIPVTANSATVSSHRRYLP